MSRLTIYPDNSAAHPLLDTSDGEQIAAALRPIQVRFERWSASRELPTQVDDAAVMEPGDERRLAGLGRVAPSDLGVRQPIEHAAMDPADRGGHMAVDDRDDIGTRRLADRQCAEGPLGHASHSNRRREDAILTTCRSD